MPEGFHIWHSNLLLSVDYIAKVSDLIIDVTLELMIKVKYTLNLSDLWLVTRTPLLCFD